MKIVIVISQTYWDELMADMLESAQAVAQEHDVMTEVVKVPGSFDIPLFAQRAAKRDDVDGVVTLGAIVTGETAHDEIIAYAVAEKLLDISLECNKPVVLGVNGPRMTYAQAKARIPRAGKVMQACIDMVNL